MCLFLDETVSLNTTLSFCSSLVDMNFRICRDMYVFAFLHFMDFIVIPFTNSILLFSFVGSVPHTIDASDISIRFYKVYSD
jgi:hypothetical protein